MIDLVQLAGVHLLSEYAGLGNFLSTQDVEQISKMMEDKRIIEEVRDIYNSNLKPLLIEQVEAPVSKVPVDFILPRLTSY